MPLSDEHIKGLVALGVDRAVIELSNLEEEDFETVLHAVTILKPQMRENKVTRVKSPIPLQGPKEPVNIAHFWQLELLAGKIDEERLPTVVEDKTLVEWKDNAGLNIVHYVALSGNAAALSVAMGMYPDAVQGIAYTLTGKTEDIKLIHQKYPSLTTQIAQDGTTVTGFIDLNREQVDLLKLELEDGFEDGASVPRRDGRRNTIAHYAALAKNNEAIKQLIYDDPELFKKLWQQNSNLRKPERAGLDKLLEESIERIQRASDETEHQTEADIKLLVVFQQELPLNNEGYNIAHLAAGSSNIGALQAIHALKPALLSDTDDNGKTIAHYATEANPKHWSVIKWIYAEAPELMAATFVEDSFGSDPWHALSEKDTLALNEIRTNVLGEAKARLIAGTSAESDLTLLLSAAADKRHKSGLMLVHLAAVGGKTESLQYFLKKMPKLMKKLWVKDKKGKLPDFYAETKATAPSVILKTSLQTATEHMCAGQLEQTDIDLLLTFKSEWKKMVAEPNVPPLEQDIQKLDTKKLTRSNLLHLILLSRTDGKSRFIEMLERFINRLPEEEIDDDQAKALKIIVRDNERGVYGPGDTKTKQVAHMIGASDTLYQFREYQASAEDELDADDFPARIEHFHGNVKRLPSSHGKSFVLNYFLPALKTLNRDQVQIAKQMVSAPLGLYILRRPDSIPLHLNHSINYGQDNTQQNNELVLKRMLKDTLNSAENANKKGALSDFCASVSVGNCFESRTRAVFERYGDDLRAGKPKFSDEMGKFLVDEYMPYMKTMHGKSEGFIIEDVADFILERHSQAPCEASEVETYDIHGNFSQTGSETFGQSGKIERADVEAYLERHRGYKHRVEQGLGEENPDDDKNSDFDMQSVVDEEAYSKMTAAKKKFKKVINRINKRIDELQREIDYIYNYFYIGIKKAKIEALEEFKRLIEDDGVSPQLAAAEIKKDYAEASYGFFSRRTKRLFDYYDKPGEPKHGPDEPKKAPVAPGAAPEI